MSTPENSLSGPGPAAAGQDRPAGFVAITAGDIANNTTRIRAAIARLNDLGGRLIGVDQLPRNQREKTEHVKGPGPGDAPRPVLSDSENVTQELKVMALVQDELEELVGFLEQL